MWSREVASVGHKVQMQGEAESMLQGGAMPGCAGWCVFAGRPCSLRQKQLGMLVIFQLQLQKTYLERAHFANLGAEFL